MNKIYSFSITLFLILTVMTGYSFTEQPSPATGFTENKGQWPEEVHFLFQGQGMNAWITDNGIVYDFRKVTILKDPYAETVVKGTDTEPNMRVDGHVVKMELMNGWTPSELKKNGTHSDMKNYFLGNDPAKWGTDVATFDEVVLTGVYNGVDLRYYTQNGSLRYDFIVHPGADANAISWAVNGAETSLGSNGEPIFNTSLGQVRQSELYAYQLINGRKKQVECVFELQEENLTFNLGKYDNDLPLIIDPVIYIAEWGSVDGYDEFYRIEVDNAGAKWCFGETQSVNYPTSSGAYSTTYAGGNTDFIILKINPAGDNVVFSTYLGGDGEEELFSGNTTALANDGGLVFTGTTQSTNFPTVIGAFDSNYNADRDAIVGKLNSNGNSLIFSTYFGGVDTDYGGLVSLDAQQNVYMVGWTDGGASSYPVTGGAYDQTANGGGDVGVTKFNPNCSSVVYSTLFGGNAYDDCYGSEVDAAGNITVLGYSQSTDLPASSGYQSTNAGGNDMSIFKLNSTGSNLLACSYLGGSGDDTGRGLDRNTDGNYVISGSSNSTDFPIVNGWQTNSGGYDAVIATMNSNLNTLIFGNYFGGAGDDFSDDVVTDANNTIYISGTTNSANIPTFGNADQTNLGGMRDAFVVRFEPDTNWILYSSYFGGNGDDLGRSIWCNDEGDVYVGGVTGSSNLPITPPSVGDGQYGGVQGLIFGLNTCAVDFAVAASNSPVCEGEDILLYGNMVNTAQNFSWTGPNNYSSNEQYPHVFNTTLAAEGTYNYTVTEWGCSSTTSVFVEVEPGLGTNIIGPSNVDPLTPTNYLVGQNLGSTYTWSVSGGTLISGQGTNSVSITFPTEGTATVTITEVNGNCSETSTITVNVGCTNAPNPPTVTGSNAVDENSTASYSVPAQSGYSYVWTVTGGNIISGQGTNAISVQWGSEGTGNVSIIWADANGCESTSTNLTVTIEGISNPDPQWITIASDPDNDGVDGNLMDGTLLEYLYDESSDSLYFRVTVASITSTNAQAVGVNVHLSYSGGGATFDFWGDDNNVNTNPSGWNRMITTWVTGNPPMAYSGTIGIADASGVTSNNFTNVAQDNISISVDQTAKTITLGLLRADAIPNSAVSSPVNVAAAVGSNEFWNDDIYQPGATINVAPQGIFENNARKLSIYPNPNNGTFSLDLRDTDFSTDAILSVIDNTGRTVLQRRVEDLLVTMDLQSATNGIYMLRVSENNAVGTARVAVFR